MEGKILAIDYGEKRVGVATGDLALRMAFPKAVIENKNSDYLLSQVCDLCREVAPKVVIVGWPMNMEDGMDDNKMMLGVKKFFDRLVVALASDSIEFRLIDERLSSFEAEDLLRNSNISSRDFKKGSDAVAAQLILQRYFDGLV